MLTALFLLEIGLKVLILVALWLIWRRMDDFEGQLTFIKLQVNRLVKDPR